MREWIIYLIGSAAILPIVTLVMTVILLKKVGVKKKALLKAIDVTTIFFVISVFIHVDVLIPSLSPYYLLYGLIGIGIIVTCIHWKKYGDLLFSKLIKQYWRLTFLVFFLVYVGLSCYGLIKRINEYIA